MNSQNFEIPDYASKTRGGCRQCFVGDPCLDIFDDPDCLANLGITCAPNNAPPVCTCHDICVEEVRLIGTASGNCEFTQCFNFPPIGPCRLGAGVTLPSIDTTMPCRVFIVCAQEVLNSPACDSISAQIRILLLCHTMTNNTPGTILLPLDLMVNFNEFFRFPECTGPVTGDELQNALTEIDGSCLVIQLKAQAVPFGTTTQLVISGKIIDKLWKNENLWVTGIRPYDLNAAQRNEGFVSFTVHDVFNNSHKIRDCGPIPCPIVF